MPDKPPHRRWFSRKATNPSHESGMHIDPPEVEGEEEIARLMRIAEQRLAALGDVDSFDELVLPPLTKEEDEALRTELRRMGWSVSHDDGDREPTSEELDYLVREFLAQRYVFEHRNTSMSLLDDEFGEGQGQCPDVGFFEDSD
jgi:hypothetical protein